MSTIPPSSGNPPPAPHPGFPPAPSLKFLLPKSAYTPWITRVAATLIDGIPFVFILGAGWLAGEFTLDCSVIRDDRPVAGYCTWVISDSGQFTTTGTVLLNVAGILSLVAYFLAIAYWLWNLGYRQGRTGSSLGKSMLKFKVVGERTWQPIGPGQSVARQFAHFIDYLACYVGYLWPLWDSARQTLADKVMSTVCVPIDSEAPDPSRVRGVSRVGVNHHSAVRRLPGVGGHVSCDTRALVAAMKSSMRSTTSVGASTWAKCPTPGSTSRRQSGRASNAAYA